MTTSELREWIARAFAAGVRPATADEIGEPTEHPAFGELEGKAWHEVPAETVFALRWDLELFTRRGFRYYLPAFLSLALEDAEVAETLTAYLMRPSSHRDALTPTEKDAVRAVLRHLRDGGDAPAAEALAACWESLPVSPRELERERLGRALLEAFPVVGADSWADHAVRPLAFADAELLAAREPDELRAALPAHLLALLGGEPTSVAWFLSPSRNRDRARLDALVRTLSAPQARVIGDLLAFARESARDAATAADDDYWRAAAAGSHD